SKYLRLFELMAETEVLDENRLKSRLYDGKPPSSTHYTQLKAYLYELILKCLQSFDEHQTAEYRINQLLQGVTSLYKRGLYEDCLDLLKKAERLAKQHEAFAHRLEVIRWEKQLAYTRMDADYLHRHLEQLLHDEQQVLDQLRNAAEYRKAFFQVYSATLQRASLQRSAGPFGQIQNIVDQEIFSSPDLAISHRARVMYYRTLNIYHYGAMQYEQFYHTGKSLIGLLESQPHFLRESLSEYIAALSNFILSCGLLGKYEEVRHSLLKLRSLRPITEDDRRKIHRQYFSNIFVLYIYTGELEEARREMLRCQREAADFDPKDYETASFYFQYALICLGNADFSGALDHLNHWLGQPKSVEREDLQSLARIMLLILHYEMGNTELLDSLLRSTIRFLRKKNRFFEVEKRFTHMIGDLSRAVSARDRHRA
ncbi:MAG TPA: hypothetical protein PKD78_15350, partial [Saprospiraceae bacterium]|nr:hypothetical protein [Saprospiraceae bacterium]